MKITKQRLVELNACKDGLDRFISQTNDTDKPVSIVSLIGGENTIGDMTWLASELRDKQNLVKFACKCSLINIKLVKPYTDEYDFIIDFLNNPSDAAAHTAVGIVDTATRIIRNNNHTVHAAIASHDAICAMRAIRTAANATYDIHTVNIYVAGAYAANTAHYVIEANPESKPIVEQYLKELFTK
jgi:hypothetical protein